MLGPALLLLALRGAQLRSVAAQLYAGEAAGVGRLQWELASGTFAWSGPARFVIEHTYQYFAQGTAALQVVALLLSPVFGHTLTGQHAAAITLEAAGVAACAAALLRVMGPGQAALGALLLVVTPSFVTTFALQPYGNHTEYVWVPMLMACALVARPGAELGRGGATALGGLMTVGQVLYRLNGLASLAALVVLGWGRDRRAWALAALAAGVAAVGAALLFRPLGLTPWGMNPESLGSFPEPSVHLDRLVDGLRFAWRRGIPGVRLGGDGGSTHRAALLLGLAAAALAWRPVERSDGDAWVIGSRFASLWAALALLAPLATANSFPRYYLHGFAALSLCLALQLAHPNKVARALATGALVLLCLAGARENARYVAPGTWDRPMPTHDLWFVLEVDTLDADELPFYRRIIDEARGSGWVGRTSHHSSNVCPRWPGTGPDHPRPAADHCAGWEAGELAVVLADVVRRTEGAERERALQDVGRGAWIRSNRRIEAVRAATEGADEAARAAVLRGAEDEARRQ